MERYKSKPEKKVIGRPLKKGVPRAPTAGRQKGTTNRIPTLFKECLELAVASTGMVEPIYLPKVNPRTGKTLMKNGKPVLTNTIIGQKGTGKDGVVGYMKWMCLYEPKAIAGLIARTMPLQVTHSGVVEATVKSRFDGVDTAKMTLTELTVAFREAVGLTQALPSKPKLVEHRPGMLIEGSANKDEEAA